MSRVAEVNELWSPEDGWRQSELERLGLQYQGCKGFLHGKANNTGDILETVLILGRWGAAECYADAERRRSRGLPLRSLRRGGPQRAHGALDQPALQRIRGGQGLRYCSTGTADSMHPIACLYCS